MKKSNRIGESTINKKGLPLTIIEYHNANNIIVEFNDKTKISSTYLQFQKGSIKNPKAYVFKEGNPYNSGGKHKKIINRKRSKALNAYNNMFQRCYSKSFQRKNPQYIGCSVCEEWHNYQTFAEWYYSNYYNVENERMAVDKDWSTHGNNLYSPETCLIVPQTINSLIINPQKSKNALPIGVTEVNGKYVASYSNVLERKYIRIGIFETPEDAFIAYKKTKEAYIREVAISYKNKIPLNVYNALLSYQVHKDD